VCSTSRPMEPAQPETEAAALPVTLPASAPFGYR
jgi:hypothetical protein